MVADRRFVSSKVCADCGRLHTGLNSLGSGLAIECGVTHDGDRNAAISPMRFVAGSAGTACGAEGSDVQTTRRQVCLKKM
jgi:transposase